MRTELKTMAILLIALVSGLFSSCSQDEGLKSDDGKGTVKILLTDAPFPSGQVAEANVTIDKIEILKDEVSEEQNTETEGEETQNTTSRVVLFDNPDEPQQFNLLDLQNGVTAVIAESEIEAGTYRQIRMHVVESSIVLNDGTTFDLKIPSGSQSGLKINIQNGLTIADGSTSSVVLDFDVSRSFVVQGNPKSMDGIKGFIFKPVIRATVNETSGVIEGTVSTGVNEAKELLADIPVEIWQADELISTAITDENGYYSVIGLPAGTYNVKCVAEGYQDFELADIEVATNETVAVDIDLQVVESI